MDIPSTHCSLLAMLREDGDSNTAWNVFHGRYRDVILAWCYQRGLVAEAEDLTQEVLLKLFRALPRHVHNPLQGPFRSWLKTVVHNTLRDYWRKQHRAGRVAGIGGSTFLAKLGDLADLHQQAEELSTLVRNRAEQDATDVIGRVRARVNDKTWQAFVQTWYEQRSAAEVARELGLTTATIFKHAYRVKQMVREEMQQIMNREDSLVSQ
jgi:RNA polymerase sigma factor (sigma-70 family)